ncbi:MAG: GNAT family N-acetyltransferase [Rickettsiales bacterium]|nr:GNAT family N-acetyltransferase [Rickettsiales bacterium]
MERAVRGADLSVGAHICVVKVARRKVEARYIDLIAAAGEVSDGIGGRTVRMAKGEDWTEETSYQYFQNRVVEKSVFAALKNDAGEIQGVCCGSSFSDSFISAELAYDKPSSFYISLVAVSPSQRRNGYAQYMVSQYCDMIHSLGYSTILVRCRAENKPIQGILHNNNFTELHRYQSELGGVICERIVLTRKLS